MLDAEMGAHLGFSKSSPEIKDTDNSRNGYTEKLSELLWVKLQLKHHETGMVALNQ